MCQRAGFRSALTVLPLLGRIAAALPFAISIASNAQVTAVATTTQLSVAVPAVAVGVPALHMARVTDSSSHPVPLGTVTFYDGSRSLGSAQIVSHPGGRFTQGTASVKAASLILGANSITAVFAGTMAELAGTSATKTVTVTGKSQTTITLSAALVQGRYALTTGLLTAGAGVATGNVGFFGYHNRHEQGHCAAERDGAAGRFHRQQDNLPARWNRSTSPRYRADIDELLEIAGLRGIAVMLVVNHLQSIFRDWACWRRRASSLSFRLHDRNLATTRMLTEDMIA
jgi:hypothetical protein